MFRIAWPSVALSNLVQSVQGDRADAQSPSREKVVAFSACALVAFYHDHCSKHGGYVWRYQQGSLAE